jgi:DNA-binding NarL/FixJ family response regulator
MKTRVILADDHAIMRQGLRLVLRQVPDLEVVGEACNGRDAVELVRGSPPDVVVIDVSMPDLNGIEATRQIKAIDAGIKVVGLSAHADERFVLGMLNAGASGYVNKAAAASELVSAIDAVRRGKRYLSSDVTTVVLESCLREPGSANQAGAIKNTAFAVLTPKEREVLQLLSEGKASKEIARRLEISTRTVEVHRRNLMKKLDLHSSAELTKYAVREGLTDLDT